MNTNGLAILALGSVLMITPASARPQQDQGSVADAARKAQAEKKSAPKAKLVIDNDNLNTLKGTINVVGQEPAAADGKVEGAAKGEQAAKAPAEKAPVVKDESFWREKFADANKKLAEDQRELDILQREYNLKQQQFYTDPMASLKQEYSRQDLNDQKARIDDKTAAIAQDKQDLANLEDELRHAGGDAGWASAPSQPQPQK